MGKIAMVESSDGEHTNEVQNCRHYDGKGAPPYPDNAKTHKVHGDEGKAA
jgi:hypothetical protein